MKTHLWCSAVIFSFIAGWFAGRAKPAAETAPSPEPVAVAAMAAAPPRSGADARSNRARWVGEVLTGDPFATSSPIEDMPPDERGAAIEEWLRSRGIGGIDGATVDRLRRILDVWVAADSEGAWQWAAGLADPGLRELAMTGIAGSLAGSDPARAFDCLIAHGVFNRELNDSRLLGLMGALSKEAAKQGPLAIVELWEKLPKAGPSVKTFSGIELELGPDTDFRVLNDALRSRLGGTFRRPLYPCLVMSEWMRRDPGAATGYVLEKMAANESIAEAWNEVRGVVAGERGAAAADAWTLDLLRSLPEGQKGALLTGANYPNSPERFFELLRGASGEEAAAWIGETLQSSADKGIGAWQIIGVLGGLPMDARIDHLKNLRGAKALAYAGEAMAAWEFSESLKEEVSAAISRL